MSAPVILIAGGGTGGHVFPGLAVAEAMRAIAEVEVVFCGTARGLEARAVPARGFRLECLDVRPIKGGGALEAVRGSAVALRATAEALATVRRLRPRAVLSLGGYAAGPVTLAAAMLGVPVGVLEANSTVGLANRLLGRVAKRAYVAWEDAERAFRPGALRRFGVPLRAGFVPRSYVPAERPRLLVMGGSQGARGINERMPAAIGRVLAQHPSLEVVHQSGRTEEEAVRAAYARAPLAPDVRAHVTAFIDDPAGAITAADVIVARAGAVTLAEICAVGRAAILIPFPHATDDHQSKNAEALARMGGAVCLRQSTTDATALADALIRLLGDDEARAKMARRAGARGRPNAAGEVAADLLALGEIPRRAANGDRGSPRGGPASPARRGGNSGANARSHQVGASAKGEGR